MLAGAGLPVTQLEDLWGLKNAPQEDVAEHARLMHTQELLGAIFSAISDEEDQKALLKELLGDNEHVAQYVQ